MQGSRILVQENNILVPRRSILVQGNDILVQEIQFSCTRMSHSCTGEQHSCTGEQHSGTGERHSCTGEPHSCLGERHSGTRMSFPKTRNWHSCNVYSLLFSTLHKNDIRLRFLTEFTQTKEGLGKTVLLVFGRMRKRGAQCRPSFPLLYSNN